MIRARIPDAIPRGNSGGIPSGNPLGVPRVNRREISDYIPGDISEKFVQVFQHEVLKKFLLRYLQIFFRGFLRNSFKSSSNISKSTL